MEKIYGGSKAIDLTDLKLVADRVLRSGTILTDDESSIVKWDLSGRLYVDKHIRIRTIEWQGSIYYHKYGGGELLEFKMLT